MKNVFRKHTLAIIIVFGLILRVIHIVFWNQTPYWNGLYLDELFHHIWAKSIIVISIIPKGVFFRAPLYPYFLAAVYSVFNYNSWAPRIIQNLIGLSSIIPIYFLCKRTLGKNKWANLTTILWAICPIQIFFESRLLLDSLFTALIPWLLYFLTRIKNSWKETIVPGILFGLLATLRPTIFILIPIFIIFLLPKLKLKAFFILLFAIIPIIPVTLSNWFCDDRVLIASQGGINFYIGNNPLSDGSSAIVPEFGWNWQYRQCKALAEKDEGRELKPSEISNYYFNKGLQFWEKYPKSAVILFFQKIVLLVSAYEIGNNGNIYFLLKGSFLKYILWIGWPLIFSLAIIGFFGACFEFKKLFLWSSIIYMIVIVLFFVCSRLRLPIIPMLIVPAGFGIRTIYNSVKRRSFVAFLSFIVLFALLHVSFLSAKKSENSLSRFSLGNVYLRSGKDSLAIKEYRSALSINSKMRGVNLHIGAYFFKKAQFDSAEYYFQKEIDNEGEMCRALSNLGVVKRLIGEMDSAIFYGKKGFKKCSEDQGVTYNYLISLYSDNKFIIADSIANFVYATFKSNPRILNLFGILRLTLFDTVGAESFFISAAYSEESELIELYDIGTIYSEEIGLGASRNRARAWALFNLAQIEVRKGNYNDAQNILLKSVDIDTTFYSGYAALGALFLAKDEADSAYTYLIKAENLGFSEPEFLFNLASVMARKGNYTVARKYLQRAIEINPDFELAKQALSGLNELIP